MSPTPIYLLHSSLVFLPQFWCLIPKTFITARIAPALNKHTVIFLFNFTIKRKKMNKRQKTSQTESAEKPWPSAPERLELLANMAPDTEPLSVNLSRKWRCPSIRNTNLHSVVQPRSKEPVNISNQSREQK